MALLALLPHTSAVYCMLFPRPILTVSVSRSRVFRSSFSNYCCRCSCCCLVISLTLSPSPYFSPPSPFSLISASFSPPLPDSLSFSFALFLILSYASSLSFSPSMCMCLSLSPLLPSLHAFSLSTPPPLFLSLLFSRLQVEPGLRERLELFGWDQQTRSFSSQPSAEILLRMAAAIEQSVSETHGTPSAAGSSASAR